MKNFLELFVDMLDTENEVKMDSYLSEIEEWDSLSVISFVAMVDIHYGKKILATDVRRMQTVQDLYNFVAGE